MTRAARVSAALLCLVSSIAALPLEAQHVLKAASGLGQTRLSGFNVLEHLAGCSPYFELDSASAAAPSGCKVESAAYIIRHGAIYANDEEWDATMKPFVEKLERFVPSGDAHPHLAFLRNWTSPINEDNLELLTEPGAREAEELGKSFGQLYAHLKPSKASDRFLLWAADTPRDVSTAQAFIRGALPEHDSKGKGEGDGHVQLIKVPKKTPNWKESLTPHKACPRFSKQNGQPERELFKQTYLPAIVERFDEWLPGFTFSNDDVYAMQQLCGYETVIRGERSPMCDAFRDDEFLSFEYAEDLRYHYMMGYGFDAAPSLGFPFLRTAVSRLLNVSLETHSIQPPADEPTQPPDDASTGQKLFLWFSHREEMPLIATSLGLFNNSDLRPDINNNETMPSDHIPTQRLWWTSQILPYLGHVSLEKLVCDGTSYVRTIVNSTPVGLPYCADGPGGSCSETDFLRYMRGREALYGDFEGACGIDKKHA